MKTFIIKSLLFSGIVLSIFFFISWVNKPKTDLRNDYMAAIIDKHKKLEEIKENRLLLVGGSNLAFGINSEKMEEQLAGKHVLNMGLHAGLGHDFIMNEAVAEVKQGDIVVLILEYGLYSSEKEPDVALIDHTQEMYPVAESYYFFSLKNWESLFYGNFKRALEKSRIDTTTVYNRKSFNKWGDVVAHLGKKKSPKLKGAGKWSKISLSTQRFYELDARCKSVGAQLFITFPNYPQSQYEVNKTVIKELEADIRKELSFIPIVGTPEMFVLDDSYFFDTTYHLNEEGREKRTDLLIGLLRENIRSSSTE